MNFSVKLDCKLGNPSAVFEHHAALSAAFQMAIDYFVSKEVLIGIGPELYAEQWLRNFTNYSSLKFGDLIIIYFGKILWGITHG
jgi:hypothetical protein